MSDRVLSNIIGPQNYGFFNLHSMNLLTSLCGKEERDNFEEEKR